MLETLNREVTKPNVDHSLIMRDVRQLIATNESVQKLADEIAKPAREGRNGAVPRNAYHVFTELDRLVVTMKEKYGF